MNFYDIIDSKIVDVAEIGCILFEHCNYSCVFCPQNHKSLVGASREEILSKAKIISEWINNNKRATGFNIQIMGGEVFQDRWIEKGFLNHYQDFMNYIKENTKDDTNLIFCFITNLSTNNHKDELYEFAISNNLKFNVSYDPIGRYNKNQFEIFKTNIEKFKNNINLISLVGTIQNVEAILSEDEYFNHLSKKFKTFFENYMPATKNDLYLMPTESKMLELNKFLMDKHPKNINIEPFISPSAKNRKMTCTRGNSLTIMPDNTSPLGCSGSALVKDTHLKETHTDKVVLNFFEKYNCFECEFFKECPSGCFVRSDYKNLIEDVDECIIKTSFKYGKNKNV